MSFSFGGPPATPKTASGFTLPSSTPVTTAATGALTGSGFAFKLNQPAGAGDNKPAPTLFSTPFKPATTTSSAGLTFNLGQPATNLGQPATNLGQPATNLGQPATNLGQPATNLGQPATNLGQPAINLGQPAKTTAASFGFGTSSGQTTQASGTGGLSFGLASTSASTAATTSAPSLQFSFGTPASSASTTSGSTSFTPILGGTTASSTQATGLTFGTPAATTTTTAQKSVLGTTPASTAPSIGFALGGVATAASVAPTQPTITTPSISATGSLTFAQLEDSINKWTIDLEEQGKYFVNQAKQLNAWDTLLISNGEKILNLNSSIERVKQQQSQLDQELDFILAQQKELEELIVPLEKELVDIPVTDIDRNQMYQFSEIIDSQLKQISDDLKEIIENINEANKDEEISNPITQISKILNAHMDSLQWIDTNTAQISRQLEEISRIEDANRRNLDLNNSITMF